MYETLETPRLLLRKARDEDLESILKNVWSDAGMARFMLWEPIRTRDAALARMARTKALQEVNYAWFVCLRETDEPIGFGGIRQTAPGEFEELGLCIATAYQGKGLGRELLEALTGLAFEKLGANRFFYGCFHENLASAALCKSFGFVYVKSMTETRKWDGYEYLCDLYVLEKHSEDRNAETGEEPVP